MHDPRRPEVPGMTLQRADADAVEVCRTGGIEPTPRATHAIAYWLRLIYRDGAITGMKAQYEHDQKRAASQR